MKDAANPPFAACHALVATGRPEDRQRLQRLFQRSGVKSTLVADLSEAPALIQRACQQNKPFQILLVEDTQFLKLGAEPYARLIPSRSGLKQILLWSGPDGPDTEIVQRAGFAACFTRPVEERIFFGALCSICKTRSGEAIESSPPKPKEPEIRPVNDAASRTIHRPWVVEQIMNLF